MTGQPHETILRRGPTLSHYRGAPVPRWVSTGDGTRYTFFGFNQHHRALGPNEIEVDGELIYRKEA